MPRRSGCFLFAHFWNHEDEVHRQCRCSMNIHDNLPGVVRRAIHESGFYTEPEAAMRLVKCYGPKVAVRLILDSQQDLSLRNAVRHMARRLSYFGEDFAWGIRASMGFKTSSFTPTSPV
jgi:hypothetical protein